MFHNCSVLDLPPLAGRYFDFGLGPHDCWPYHGPLVMRFQPAHLRVRYQARNPWQVRPAVVNRRPLALYLCETLRPAPEGMKPLPGRVCGSKYPLLETYTVEQLDNFSYLAPVRWSEWAKRNEIARPHKVCLRCFNPNHAEFRPLHEAPAPRPPSQEEALAKLVRATGGLLFADPPVTTEEALHEWAERVLQRSVSISSNEWVDMAQVLADEVEHPLRGILTAKYGKRRYDENDET